MKRTISFVLSCIICLTLAGQSSRDQKRWARSIETNHEEYISARSVGPDETTAHSMALAALVSQISVDVSSAFKQKDFEVQTGNQISSTSKVESIIRTYSTARLKDVGYLVLGRSAQETEVFCYISRENLKKVFEAREARVKQYIAQAQDAEKQRKIDDALTFYYWAYCLLKTLPNAQEVRDVVDGRDERIGFWLPFHIKRVMENLETKIAKWEGREIDLLIDYDGEPVTTLQFQVFNGVQLGRIYTAKNGRAHITLPEMMNKKDGLQIAYAYERIGEAQSADDEVMAVLNTLRNPFGKDVVVMSENPVDESAEYNTPDNIVVNSSAASTFANVTSVVMGTPKEQKENEHQLRQLQSEASEAATSQLAKDIKPLHRAVRMVVDAIKIGRYESARACFTEAGYQMFEQLIHYGEARVIGKPEYAFYVVNDKVVCRSIPMSFSFPNSRQSFSDDVTLTFNAEGKIEAVAFALDQIARNDIFQTSWPDNVKMVIASFMENYQTAFALKRLDYIEQLFHDDAIIITGTVLKRPKMVMESQKSLMGKPSVKYTEHSKQQYIENLRACFKQNDFVHIRFTETDFRASNNEENGELYGIQIHQNYASTTYSDDGYLFLLVDFNKPEQPLILLRTWQPERDPGIYSSATEAMRRRGSRNFGLYNMSYF